MEPAPTLAFDRHGGGEPLVLLHPLGADRGVWEPVIEPLAAVHDVMAVDMPGFGESAELGSEVAATPEAIAATAAATLDSLSPGFTRANTEMPRSVFSGLERIEVPVTLAWSDRDRLVGRPTRELPGIRTVTLTECGHLPTWDSPAQVTEAILSTTSAPGDLREPLSG